MSTTRQSAHICRRLNAPCDVNIECPASLPSIASTTCFVPKAFLQRMQWKGSVRFRTRASRTAGVSKYGLGNRAVKATVDMFGVRWLLSRRLDYKARGQ